MKLNIKVDFISFDIMTFSDIFWQDNFKILTNAQENEVFYIIFTFTFYILMELGMINGVNASGITRRVWKDEVKDYNTNESKLQQPQVTSIQRISGLIKLSLCQLFSSNVWNKLEN